MNTPPSPDHLRSDHEFEQWESDLAARPSGRHAVASAAMVNRTHRIVRERALTLQARKSRVRSLWIPLAVSGGLLAVIVFAVWSVLDQYEVAPTGLPDASQQMLVFLMWCLPVSAAVLAIVWFRHQSSQADNGSRG